MTCGQVRVEKSLKIHNAPDILVLHLKRFKFTTSGRKIDTQVAFPERLELERYMSPSIPAQFSLVGVVVHDGATLGSGHYFAYVKSDGGAWFLKNDDEVSVARLPSSALVPFVSPSPSLDCCLSSSTPHKRLSIALSLRGIHAP